MMMMMIYYPKINTANLVIYNDFSLTTSNLSTTKAAHELKFPRTECFSIKISIFGQIIMSL